MTASHGDSEFVELSPVKVVIIGDSGVGKTCLSRRYANNTFDERGPVLTMMGTYFEAVRSYGNLTVRFGIWDTAGSERFQAITPLYYRGAEAAVIVYDITNSRTFYNIHRWSHQLRSNTSSVQTTILCGNKLDNSSGRQVSVEEAEALACELNLHLIESSAKTGENVEEIFQQIAFSLAEQNIGSIRRNSTPRDIIKLHDTENESSRTKKRCLCSN